LALANDHNWIAAGGDFGAHGYTLGAV